MRRFTMVGLCASCLALALFGAISASAASAAAPAAASWGLNTSGQLGNGTTETSFEPGPVSGLSQIVEIAGGGSFSLALLNNGTVVAWGANNKGQLGDGNTTSSSVPVPVSGLSNVVAISAGGEHALALLANGHVKAWGQNENGQLGDGEQGSSDVPVEVLNLSEVTAISAGGKHSLALLSDHRVKAWGADSNGQLGNGEEGSLASGQNKPVEVKELGGVTAIAAGGAHSLALLENGTVESFGANKNGQLGNGGEANSDTPIAVKGLIGVHAIAAGNTHSLALLNGGEVWAWGSGGSGQLGNGAKGLAREPVQTSGLTEVSAISAGNNYSLALQTSGTVEAWGLGTEGQLGNGSKGDSTVPVANSDIHGVTAVSAGGAHVLALGPLLPTVTSVSPVAGRPGGGTAVTITGTHFTGVTAVDFGASPAGEVKVESETTIHAVAPAGSGTVNVTVTEPGGTSPDSPSNVFSYGPVVSSVNPASGVQQGGTKVVIQGSNFEGISAVSFGASSAASFKVESTTEVTAIAPTGSGVVDVTVTGPGGTSAKTPGDQFTYLTSPPEVGRCVKVVTKHSKVPGDYSDGACTKAESGKFEWKPGPGAKGGFKIKATEKLKFETVSNPTKEVECTNGGRAAGEYLNSKTIANLVFTFTGCKAAAQCTSPPQAGEKEIKGRIVTAKLEGHLGIIGVGTEPSQDQVGFEFGAPANGTFMEFECGSLKYVWRGAVIVPYRTTDKMFAKAQLRAAEDKGHQSIEEFEDEPKSVLSVSIGGAAYEQAGMLATLELSNKEKTEINLLH